MPVTVRARKTRSTPAPSSVRAFARLQGVSHTAVQQRIAEGALPTGAKKIGGRWKIVDAVAAAAEWEAHTRPRVADDPKRAPRAPSELAKATQRERNAKAAAAEFDLEVKRGKYVLKSGVKLLWAARMVAYRNKMRTLAAHLRQRVPHLSVGDMAIVDELVREALDELADGVNDEPKGEPA